MLENSPCLQVELGIPFVFFISERLIDLNLYAHWKWFLASSGWWIFPSESLQPIYSSVAYFYIYMYMSLPDGSQRTETSSLEWLPAMDSVLDPFLSSQFEVFSKITFHFPSLKSVNMPCSLSFNTQRHINIYQALGTNRSLMERERNCHCTCRFLPLFREN